jgi:hypothetical protein
LKREEVRLDLEQVEPNTVLDLLKENVCRVVEWVWGGKSVDLKYRTPSISGHHFANRQNGGALGELWRSQVTTSNKEVCIPVHTWATRKKRIPIGTHTLPPTSILLAMYYSPKKQETRELRVFYNPEDVNSHCLRECQSMYGIRSDWCLATPKYYKDGDDYCFGPPCASVYSVCEPFKARIVTAGPVELYHLARQLQRPMHGEMRKKSVFSLIGQTNTPKLLNEIIYGTRIFPEEFWVAGDYSAATDGMHPELCAEYIRACSIQMGLRACWADILKMSMTGHRLFYKSPVDSFFNQFFNPTDPEWDEEEFLADGDSVHGVSIQQTWGQLMGSPSSFLALCAVNLAIAITSYQLYKPQSENWTIDKICRNMALLINGDDISFKSDEILYNIWTYVAGVAGMNPSPGKNFCSREFININSTCYWANYLENDYRKKMTHVNDVFSLNPGLIKGQGRVLSNENNEIKLLGDSKNFSAKAQLEYCMREGTFDQCEKIKQLFFKYNLVDLKASHRSWSLPREFGGLGLPYFANPNYSQRKLAGALCVDHDNYYDLSTYKENADYLKMCADMLDGVHEFLGHCWSGRTLNWNTEKDEEIRLFDTDFEKVQWVPEEDSSIERYVLADTKSEKKDPFLRVIRKVLSRPYINPVGDDFIKKLGEESWFFSKGNWSGTVAVGNSEVIYL